MTKAVRDENVVSTIMGHFRLDKLCPECNGPMERRNRVRCNWCSTKRHIATQVNAIETAAMSIGYDIGIRGVRSPVKEKSANKRNDRLKQRKNKGK